tara:strand:- start:8263 stop:9102 length:840 start_codon:yes stop_codon:yes gene_type:complete
MRANCLYEEVDQGIFDYNCTDNKIGDVCGFRNFDGKQKDIVCIGAAQTMGRFVHNDYPSLIENNSDYSVANLGWGGAGVHQYDTKEFIEYINNSKLLIYQILSGRSMPNIHKNFSIPKSELPLKSIVKDSIASIPQAIDHLYRNDYDKFIKCFENNSVDYLRACQAFRNKIKVPVMYIHISRQDWNKTIPPKPETNDSSFCHSTLYAFPHLVTGEMVKKLVGNDKLGCFRQADFIRLPSRPKNYKSVVEHSHVFFTNQYYPDQETHYDIAEFCIKNMNI